MSKWVEEVYDETFEVVVAEHEFVFVDFYADWCGPCKAVAPVVERVAKEYAGRIKFAKLNTDGNPATARMMRITSIPALLLFRQGKVVMRTGGYQSDAELRRRIEAYAPASSEDPTNKPAARPRGLLSRMFSRD